MKNKLGAVILAAVMLAAVFAAGCGSSSAVSMYDLRTAMEAADDTLGEMLSADSSEEDAEDLFAYVSDMDYSKVDKFFVSYSNEGTADEIAVIALKNASDAQEAVNSLKEHVQDRINVFSQYAPEQVKKAENAITFKSGSYAVLIICDKQDEVKKAFTDFISK